MDRRCRNLTTLTVRCLAAALLLCGVVMLLEHGGWGALRTIVRETYEWTHLLS